MPDKELTDADRRALEVIAQFGARPFTCTELGEQLFSGTAQHRPNRQCFARPAGKVLRRLQRAGHVGEVDVRCTNGRIKRCWVRLKEKIAPTDDTD
jgi:hypothetical protein